MRRFGVAAAAEARGAMLAASFALGLALFAASAARADTSPRLIADLSLGGELSKQQANGFPSSETGPLLELGGYMQLGASTDLGFKARLFTVLSSIAGTGSSMEAVYRWFPFTYARQPTFMAGPQSVEFLYRLMPYVGGGLGVNFQSVTLIDLSRTLAVLPRVSAVVGAYVPLNDSFALDFSANIAYGQTLQKSSTNIQQESAAISAGIALMR